MEPSSLVRGHRISLKESGIYSVSSEQRETGTRVVTYISRRYSNLIRGSKMHFCFIVEKKYRNDWMPMVVIEQLRQWGHSVDVLEPHASITCLSDITKQGYDAYI